jgi:HSP20 family protein
MEEEFPGLFKRFTEFERELWGNGAFYPPANLVETETAFEVTMELPGLKPEEFHVEVREGLLTIYGKKEEEKEEKGKSFHRVERHYGHFRREMRLPLPVEEEKVTAEFRNGLLTVTIPKAKEVIAKTIEVKVK